MSHAAPPVGLGTFVPTESYLLQLTAQLAEVQARVNYAKARVELDRATGFSLEKAQVSLEEALTGRFASAGGPARSQ